MLADAVGQATGKTFTIDPRVRATMTLINPKPMTPQQLYQNFLSMLQVYGFAAVPAGNMVKIMPADAVRQMAPSGMSENSGPDEIVDAVIETKNLSAQQLNVVIRQLVPTAGTVLTVTGTNAMIINDRASNVVRIQRLVKQLDEAGAGGVEMRKLENSNAPTWCAPSAPSLRAIPRMQAAARHCASSPTTAPTACWSAATRARARASSRSSTISTNRSSTATTPKDATCAMRSRMTLPTC